MGICFGKKKIAKQPPNQLRKIITINVRFWEKERI